MTSCGCMSVTSTSNAFGMLFGVQRDVDVIDGLVDQAALGDDGLRLADEVQRHATR